MKLRRINTILCIAIVLINGYIIVTPFAPRLFFWANTHNTARMRTLEQAITPKAQTAEQPTVSGPNRLIIPSMGLEEAIHEGPTARTLRQGLWLRPQGTTPDQPGNTIIVGHRFTYTQPRGPLYSLNVVQTGERIGIVWNGMLRRYIVQEIKTVHASQTSIEAPTSEARLTIYTCTPLWLPKDRLVVIAEPEDL